ncbi:WXG100 family type VII secretion target [Actinomadura oligospora]|uniref:WXG100 family type VII secretion target n=1 Tax=Actinomadura oligospora TaxID=111804 RepID=UPI00047A5C42|nr:WXG100 family type VII secretion target [Actinomadura oligospora]
MPPKDPNDVLNGILPGIAPQGPHIPFDLNRPDLLVKPPVVSNNGAGGRGHVMAVPEQIRKVAEEMEKDVSALEQQLGALKTQFGEVGGWDVAKALHSNVGKAHVNMVEGIQAYIRAYRTVIARVRETANRYSTAEGGAKKASDGPRKTLGDPPSPWRTS